jgi:membrane-bound lytic murein transglycosylase D
LKKLSHKLFVLSIWFMISMACISTGHAQNKTPISAGQELLEAIRISEPLNFCGEQAPLADPDVRERLEREMLQSLDNSDDIILWIKRASRYFPEIERALKANALPDDLKYIAIAESSLRPLAFSNKGATGYWQFIEGTGTKYGLEISDDIDERRNVYQATQAAVKYLKKLYALFGSWTLAAAAYNMGEDGLKSELLVQKVNHYYQLYLNQETQRYVFRILAAKVIMSNPAKFGYSLSPADLYLPRQFDAVEIKAGQPVPLHIIAQAANTYFKIIKDLNPQIKYYHLPAGTRQINIPKGQATGFYERYDKLLSEWIALKNASVYTVKTGDTISGIASRFNVPYKALTIWNGIGGRKISSGDKLYIFSDTIKSSGKSDHTVEPAL